MHIKTQRLLLFLLLGFGTWSIPYGLQAKTYNLGLRWKAGKTYYLSLNTDQEIRQSVQGRKIKMNQTIRIGYTFNVRSVNKKGTAEVDLTYTNLYFKQRSMGRVIEYDSDRPTPSARNPLTQSFEMLVGKTLHVTITRKGKVKRFRGLDRILKHAMRQIMSKKINPAMRKQLKAQLMKTFGEKPMRQSIAQMMEIYPEKPVKIGDSWQKVQDVVAGYSMTLKRKWTLLAVRGPYAFLRVRTQILPGPSKSGLRMGPFQIHYNLRGTQKGSLFLRMSTGLIEKGQVKQKV
ncbi:MAG: DUF6263 family protein, partial [Myxococcota bacterium]